MCKSMEIAVRASICEFKSNCVYICVHEFAMNHHIRYVSAWCVKN